MRAPSWFRRWLEDILPWYDRDAMRAHNAYSEQLIREATISRRNALTVRRAYVDGAKRLGRR